MPEGRLRGPKIGLDRYTIYVYNLSMTPRPKGKTVKRRDLMIPDDLWRKLTQRAKGEYTSVSAIVRQAIVEYLKKG